MIRRVICLLLAVQLLLVQGLLGRACTGSCGRTGHAADRTHIHLPQMSSASARQARPRCSCCQRRAAQCRAEQATRVTTEIRDRPNQADDHGDIVYLPASLVTAVARPQGQAQLDHALDDMVASVADAPPARPRDGPLLDSESPQLPRHEGRPLYLLNRTLLI